MDRYQETLAELNQSIEQNPGGVWALAHRGEIYGRQGQYDAALADFNRAIALDSAYAWAIAHRGETYHLMRRYQDALADFDRALELKPDYVWALAHRGVVYSLIKRYQEALADFDRAIELKPDYGWVLIHRADTYIVLKRYEEGLADMDRAIALDETIISHWRGERGLPLNYLGRYSETIEECQRALQEDPDDYIAWYSLAVARAFLKGLAQAREDIDSARAVLRSVANTEVRGLVLYRLGGLDALEGKADQALGYLQEAISLHHEPIELARHDPAWHGLRPDPRFQALILREGVMVG